MEKVMEEIQKYFKESNVKDITQRIAYIIGYLEDDDRISKKDFIEILRKEISKW